MRGFSSEYFKKSSKEDEKGKYTIYFYDMKVEKQMEKAVPIKSVCYENDLYELIGEDGNVFLPNYLECCLAALEKMFGNYRRKLESKAFCKKNYKSNCFLAQEEKVFWQTYIIIQLLRLPKIIKEAEQFSGEILKKDISKKGVHNLIRVLFLPFFDENVAGDPTVAVIEGILERMKGMSFAVGIDDLGRGVTSDNPVAIYANKKGEFESVIFPVTAKICLFMFKNEEDGQGEVTSFGALCTALSATIGTGNITGVATALAAGGPGALFWMVIAAFFGMATKYAEGLLAIKYRTIDKDGHVLGGPFYYIENGMGKNWRWLAKIFAFFGAGVGLFGIGTFTQVNSISSAVKNFFDPESSNVVFSAFGHDYTMATVVTGLILTLCVGLVVIGGIKRIAKVSEIVVPFMAVLYVALGAIIIITNITAVPAALVSIIKSAFTGSALAGGAMGTMVVAMQKGIARGIFSNESGLGSAPIAAAAAKTKEPVRQGLVSMTGTFIDTIVICTMTGLSIVIAGTWMNPELEGVEITVAAFQKGLPFPPIVASFSLMLCLVFFAFTTILGWNYYGERCIEYLFNRNKSVVKGYRWLYILAVFIGPYMTVAAVWNIADIFNALMAFPNLIAILALSGVVVRETKDYFARQKKQSK